MSKIKIQSELKSNNETHIYSGNAVYKDNVIIYNDNGVITKIDLNNQITIERKKEHEVKMLFELNKKLKGTYIINGLNINLETYTKKIKKTPKCLEIEYDLILDEQKTETFLYKLLIYIDR